MPVVDSVTFILKAQLDLAADVVVGGVGKDLLLNELLKHAIEEHLIGQGIDVHLIDNESTDATRRIAQCYLGNGVLGIETMPRRGVYSWRPILQRKESLAGEIDADWFMHVDADEIRLPPKPGLTLLKSKNKKSMTLNKMLSVSLQH